MKKMAAILCTILVAFMLLFLVKKPAPLSFSNQKEAGTAKLIKADSFGAFTDIPKPKAVVMNTAKTTYSFSLSKKKLRSLPAGTILKGNEKDIILKNCFYYEKLRADIKKRIKGKSYKEDCTIPYEDLRYVRVLYYGFDEETHIGELIVNKSIASDITSIFTALYVNKYPIEKMVLIDDYNADDNASMADNNTSSFNYRAIPGSKKLSKHAQGLAIDINPLYNPYVKGKGKNRIVLPAESKLYTDRTLNNPYYIQKDDICYKIFMDYGFVWGGSWKSLKDYQHFEK